jgi:hypothetical protein
MKLAKGYKTFVLPKNFIDDVLEWHMGKKNAQATPEDFNENAPKEGTYAASTTSLAKDAVDSRSEFILEFLTSKKEVWQNGNYFDESVKYSKQAEAVRQKSGGKDFWTGKKRTRRDADNAIEHLLAKKGPNKGTDAPENLVQSSTRPNILKSNKV